MNLTVRPNAGHRCLSASKFLYPLPELVQNDHCRDFLRVARLVDGYAIATRMPRLEYVKINQESVQVPRVVLMFFSARQLPLSGGARCTRTS